LRLPQCIFCKTTHGPFNTREHILPESLGGGDWALLPADLFCDFCQNRFGSHVEQLALGDYPFSYLRVLLGIPTKKGKAPWVLTGEGTVRGSLLSGTVGYDPATPFEPAMARDMKSQFRLIAHPMRSKMICRMLLKMGLETLASDGSNDIWDERFDAARDFALTGRDDLSWWYIQYEDMSKISALCKVMTAEDWTNGVELSITEPLEQAEVFCFLYLSHTFIVPLVPDTVPPPREEFHEPEYRIFTV
jgi:hypothetical protein